ncbi:MAG: hypothetical protein ABSF21_06960 [Dehalococcoidia bacterium]
MRVTVTPEEREVLETLKTSRTTLYQQVQRAHLVLAVATGKTNQAISQEAGNWCSAGVWHYRFIRERLAGLEDRLRPGKPRQYSDAADYVSSRWPVLKSPRARATKSVRKLAQATGGVGWI